MASDCYIPYYKVKEDVLVYEKSSGGCLELRQHPNGRHYIFRVYGLEIPTRQYLSGVRRLLSTDEAAFWDRELRRVEEWILVHGEPV
jgi:hypothetical protein